MVYYDGIHLMSDTLIELHDFAENAGLKKYRFQDHKKHPHYCVYGGKNERTVLRLGAKFVDSRYLVELSNRVKYY